MKEAVYVIVSPEKLTTPGLPETTSDDGVGDTVFTTIVTTLLVFVFEITQGKGVVAVTMHFIRSPLASAADV